MFAAVVLVGHAQSPGLTGRVVADSTGEPVANARVTLTTTATVATLGAPVGLTDADGRFAIAGAADAQRVVASKSGYARSEPAATTGQPIEIRLRRRDHLRPRRGSIRRSRGGSACRRASAVERSG